MKLNFIQILISADSMLYGLTKEGDVYVYDKSYQYWRILDQVERKNDNKENK